ncbi:MAG: FtsW/RodA/SpoVE family cell cycle protein, partial [Clostridia bacterium]|nr:FtsW/RodA/SpoVE family cell cycle protein [Clostridia bacterium]
GIQAFLHMMVATRLFVNTGVTLPYFSYGGSSLVIFMAEMGVLLCISRHYCRKKSDVEREQLRRQIGLD